MIKAGTEFELTLDRQQDFYGRDATFPVNLSFKPGPKETITVEADDDGHFVASVDGKKDGDNPNTPKSFNSEPRQKSAQVLRNSQR